MKKRKHLQTNFFKFIVEKYNKEIQDELNDEETNLTDDELIDDIDDIEEPTEPKNKKKEDDDLNLDELIEEYNKLTNKYKTLKNDNSLYKRK
jgi:hypothetical protein